MPSDPPRVTDNSDARDSGRNRRATDRVLSHWHHACRNDAASPSLRDLELGAHEDVSKDCFLLRDDFALSAPAFILCGNAVSNALNLMPLGRTLESALPRSIRRKLGKACRRAVEEGQPVHTEGSYRNDAKEEFRYRSIFAPVSSRNGVDAAYVFGTFGQKEFPAAA